MASLAKLFEYIPAEVIKARTGIPDQALHRCLKNLVGYKLAAPHRRYQSIYRLTFTGLNLASLHGLVRRGLVERLGERIGVGKESLVYLAEGRGGAVAVKFHRVGVTSFRRMVRVRDYGLRFERLWWGARSIVSAEREHRALEVLGELGLRVPRAFGREHNAVVFEYIEGIDLYRARELEDPEGVLEGIVETARRAYQEAGIVHGDLSPYNVIVSRASGREEPYIIDWPQWLRSGDGRAIEILRRDLGYIADFFRRRFGLEVDGDALLKRVVEGYGGPG